MSSVTGGYPVMWHEVGDAVFWADDDQNITLGDAGIGVRAAARNVGTKYLKRPLYDELRSDVYRNILAYVADACGPGQAIKRSEALAKLPAREAKNLDNFIAKMRKLGVLRLVPGKRGEYEFTNFLFEFHVMLQSSAVRQRPGGGRGGKGRP